MQAVQTLFQYYKMSTFLNDLYTMFVIFLHCQTI